MKSLFPALLAAGLLSGCVQISGTDTAQPGKGGTFCSGAAAAICAFANAPLKLASQIINLPDRPYPFKPLADDLRFVDATGRVWIAPEGILTDGASIPPIFTKIVGDPNRAEYRNAAAIHDSYCGIGNEDTPYFHTRNWQDTHRMFYEALRVGGTPDTRAKVLFSAVYMGGPRWSLTRPHPTVSTSGEVISTQGTDSYPGHDRDDLANVPTEELQAALGRVVAEIERSDPSLPEIEALVEREVRVLQVVNAPAHVPSGGYDHDGDDYGYGDDAYGDDAYGDDVDPGSTDQSVDPSLGDEGDPSFGSAGDDVSTPTTGAEDPGIADQL